ncbi:MAG: GDP-mannose 4,6-dehydratase [Candidatus Nomurabacteria bacterium]|nr:MAG: GDP-mannose 4,6-dehydratase [Candidatus Nomurabacteria bacterium]
MSRPIFERKNILVTGGAGFIGSHLCDELVKQHKVICLDNFSTGREENINHLLQNPNFEFVKHDLSDPIDLDHEPGLKPFQVEFQGVQEIYHFASPTSPKDYLQMPVETLVANAQATRNALEMAKKYQASFLLASSDAIYGEPMERTPYPEEYWGYVNPVGSRSAFSEGKRFAESLTVHYREKYALKAKIARLFNTYGPRLRVDDGRMVPEMINAALRNETITVYGKADDTTTLCYISDIVEGLLRLMKSSELGPVNLGSPDQHRLEDVVKYIQELTGSTSGSRFTEHTKSTVIQGVPNIALAKERLGWFPVVALSEGLRRTIDYFKGAKNIDISASISKDQ